MAPPAPVRKRSIVYVDGFNFYYGVIRGTAHKWLDLQRFFNLLRPDDDVQQIRYFTAMVGGTGRARQETYLKALETLPLLEITLGLYKAKNVRCTILPCGYLGSRKFKVQEEKRTDVAIGVAILDDAYQDACDRFVIFSGDSDLVPALNTVKQRFPAKELVVYIPARNPVRGAAVELRAAADKNRTLPLNLIPRSLFAAAIPDGAGGMLAKPATW
jgi:hypothetical protein